MSNDLKMMAAITALNAMMQKGWLSMSTIDRVGEMLSINPKGEAYRILAPLHCVDFDKMPRELVEQIPMLIQQCLSVTPTFQFKLPAIAAPAPPDPLPKRKLSWL